MTTYLTYEIFPYRPDLSDDPQESYIAPSDPVQDVGIGRAHGYWDQAAVRLSALFSGLERADVMDLLDFFAAMEGRLSPFWLPAFQPSLVVEAAFLDSDTVLTVGYDDEYVAFWMTKDATGRHLLFEWPDGTQICKKVTAATAVSITLESALGKACTAAELSTLRVFFLYFVRFDSDIVEAEYLSPTCAEISLSFREIPWEAPTS